jgi:release factor glutamine methyltransferase
VNVGELLLQILPRLNSDTPELDAQVILAHILDKPRTWMLAHPETRLSAPELDSVEKAVVRLEQGEPLPYVVGHWEFFGLDFDLTPDVLIPRPETETLVETAIAWLRESTMRRTVADVGTGSGAIAIAIAMHVLDAYIIGTDISLPALQVARRNARKFDLIPRMDFILCELLPAHHDRSVRNCVRPDLRNLPLPTDRLHSLPVYGREPAVALNGGADGLDLIRRLFGLATEWLAPNGLILLEIEASQGMKAAALAYDFYAEAEIHLHQDLSGRDRLLEISL